MTFDRKENVFVGTALVAVRFSAKGGSAYGGEVRTETSPVPTILKEEGI
jgi:hypothetical protein